MENSTQGLFQLIQSQWICPITHMIIKDPVITEDGHTYQKIAIMQWLNHSNKSPKTGLYLSSKKLIPNLALKGVMQRFTEISQSISKMLKKNLVLYQQLLKRQLEQKHNILNLIKSQNQIKNNTPQQSNQTFMNLFQQRKPILQQIFSKTQLSIQKIQKQSQQREQIVNKQIQFYFKFTNKLLESKKLKQIEIIKTNYKFGKQFQQRPIQLLHHFQYLIQKFTSDKQIKARFQKNDTTGFNSLHHQRTYLDMQKFLKYDWSSLQFINFMDCQIDDYKWRLFINHSQNFPFLKQLRIFSNRITTIKEGDLQKFPFLNKILFYTYGGWTNPLTQQSKQVLKEYKINNSYVQLLFQSEY